ncbi:unnamed protein product [Trypanosoma congolense IL3000]|uniref:WGS project CAEQ00000000 data, annotated contig 653 n=1 Tax=Trypanosoma congolense (strain IL3000) TaxID=1068625 RepID=F9WHI4_TRYCI|nr:unnamed protein product [Trypanosoma congolense IL3000]
MLIPLACLNQVPSVCLFPLIRHFLLMSHKHPATLTNMYAAPIHMHKHKKALFVHEGHPPRHFFLFFKHVTVPLLPHQRTPPVALRNFAPALWANNSRRGPRPPLPPCRPPAADLPVRCDAWKRQRVLVRTLGRRELTASASCRWAAGPPPCWRMRATVALCWTWQRAYTALRYFAPCWHWASPSKSRSLGMKCAWKALPRCTVSDRKTWRCSRH